jgi:amino acid transporter
MTKLLYIPELFGVSIEVYFIILILAIPTFFIWRWIFRKYIDDKKKQNIATWIATIIATPVIYVGLVMLWIFCISYYPSKDFDKQKWLTDKEKRYELSEEIIESKMLIGKTKAEVRQILGEEENLENNDLWNYYLGYRPQLFGIDPDVLDIEFKDGRVIKVSQHQT